MTNQSACANHSKIGNIVRLMRERAKQARRDNGPALELLLDDDGAAVGARWRPRRVQENLW